MNDRLTHLDDRGNARMVDVSAKEETERSATAFGCVVMERRTLDLIVAGEVPKGDVLAVARIAGIMAAKKTSDIIPLCHPLGLSSVSVTLEPMLGPRASTSVPPARSPAGPVSKWRLLPRSRQPPLTVYDMLKAVDRGMTIEEIRLVEKSGGRSGTLAS